MDMAKDCPVGGEERQSLMTRVLDAVKQCQIRFGGKTELATESDSRVTCLCAAWESVLQHGLKHSNKTLSTLKQVSEITGLSRIGSGMSILDELRNMETEPCYWQHVKQHLSQHELQRFMLLKRIHTDAGRGRAWLRSAINEHSLEKYLHMFVGNKPLLRQYYEDWSFLCDDERSSMLPVMAAGLGSILFAIVIDCDSLNTIRAPTGLDSILSLPAPDVASCRPEEDEKPVIAGSPQLERKREKRKKKKKFVNVVSFDESDIGSYSTSPASSLSSPWAAGRGSVNAHVKVKPTINSTSVADAWDTDAAIFTFSTDNAVTRPSGAEDIHHGPCHAGSVEIRPSDSRPTAVDDSVHNRPSYAEPSDNRPPEGPFDYGSSRSTTLEVAPSCEGSFGNRPSEKACDDRTSHNRPSEIRPFDETVPCDRQSDIGPTEVKDGTNVATSSVSPPKSCVLSPAKSSDSETSMNSAGKADDSAICGTSLTSDCSGCSLDIRQGTMVPLSSADNGNPLVLYQGDDSVSCDSSDLPSYSEDTESAAIALSLVQQGVIDSLRTQGDGSQAPDPVSPIQQDTMTTGELKQAIIAMMVRKDEVEEQNRALQKMLATEREISDTLRAETDELRKSNLTKQDRDADKIKALSRENDLLKRQLKKYVNAVQLLRRQGGDETDLQGIHLDDVQPAIPNVKRDIDYSHEASEYEKKLIQVAEMHGELMEFNECLQRQLRCQDAVVTRLRSELVDLRGPLPEDILVAGDDTSLSSELDSSSPRPLVNVWMPSVFLKGNSDAYHVYQVYVRIKDEEWNVYRRYADFHQLHAMLKKKVPITRTYEFPPKKAIGNKNVKFVESRRQKLQTYLRLALNAVLVNNSELSNAICKQALLRELPFFGDTPSTKSKDKRENRRSGTSSATAGRAPPAPQQYMGL